MDSSILDAWNELSYVEGDLKERNVNAHSVNRSDYRTSR